jgi:uncharacterized protein (TIGR03066 family)
MKKVLFLLAITALSLASCKNKKDEKANTIVGNWKPVEFNISSMSEDEKKEMMNSTSLEFTADNKFLVHRNGSKREGTYKLDGKELSTSIENGKSEKFTIDWEADKLVMTNKEGVVKLKKD